MRDSYAFDFFSGMLTTMFSVRATFQAVRTERDLDSMSVPVKYRSLGDFHKYFKGESVAPVLTIFIGGNHEASNYLQVRTLPIDLHFLLHSLPTTPLRHSQELYYGGWVAPNIYFMGFSGCVMFGGLRICGLSGIYKTQDYRRGRHEMPPYDYSSCRSVYHVRELDCFKLAQLSRPVDIAMSHDWPTGIAKHGDTESLLRRKPFFRQEVEEGSLGSPPAEALLNHLKPKFWFSAHLHVKFAAAVHHDQSGTVTRFLALDKCLPRRNFLQLLRIERPPEEAGKPAVLW
jgi:lariat debranching enzyme